MGMCVQEALLESVMEQQPQNVEAMLRLATAAYKRAHIERSVIATI